MLWSSKGGFSDRYARAREIQGHVHASLAVEFALAAEDAGQGWISEMLPEGIVAKSATASRRC